MSSTGANLPSSSQPLKNLQDLKGYVDVTWSEPIFEMRETLDGKVGRQGLINIQDWWMAVDYAYERLVPVMAETRLLWNRAIEMNSTYKEPRVTLRWTKWKLEELNRIGLFPRIDTRILRDRNELNLRAELVKLTLARSLREEVNLRLRMSIVTVLGAQPEWQTRWECFSSPEAERFHREHSPEEIHIDFP